MRWIWLLLAAAATAACNGGDAGAPGGAGAALESASPGGIWHALGDADDSLTLLVAESGELKLYGAGPSFGSGAVVVTDGDRVAGSFDARGLASDGAADASVPPEHCELDGTVVERIALRLDIECTGADGATRSERRTLLLDPRYLGASSPEAVAGNYTLSFDPQANTLSINDDGVLFGIYDNGMSCTVNGEIDPAGGGFNLYRVEWTLSNCDAGHARYDGAVFSGLGFLRGRGRGPGTLALMLTGTVEGRLEVLSLIYEPV